MHIDFLRIQVSLNKVVVISSKCIYINIRERNHSNVVDVSSGFQLDHANLLQRRDFRSRRVPPGHFGSDAFDGKIKRNHDDNRWKRLLSGYLAAHSPKDNAKRHDEDGAKYRRMPPGYLASDAFDGKMKRRNIVGEYLRLPPIVVANNAQSGVKADMKEEDETK